MAEGLLINNKRTQRTETGFTRVDSHTLEDGVQVSYVLKGYTFRITATRYGIDMRGAFPRVNQLGIHAAIACMLRAVRHHEHLAAFTDGDRVIALEESVIEAEETARYLESKHGQPQGPVS